MNGEFKINVSIFAGTDTWNEMDRDELIGKGLSVLGVDIQGRVGGSIQFFLYDVIKITILLCLLIFIISYIQKTIFHRREVKRY